MTPISLGETHPPTRYRIAIIGEAMIELSATAAGQFKLSFAGDTFNTAVYLARLAGSRMQVSYVTAVGREQFSEQFVDFARSEGLDTSAVLRNDRRTLGLYLIMVDEQGERSFAYWRKQSAARKLVQNAEFEGVSHALANFDGIYLSGISLAILPKRDREALIGRLRALAGAGVQIIFDTNYRPSLWRNQTEAKTYIGALLPAVTLMLTTFDDEQRLWGDCDEVETFARLENIVKGRVVVKLGADGFLYAAPQGVVHEPVERVERPVDTTGAGDAFNAGFIAHWVLSSDPLAAARQGAVLAQSVIRHSGAIISRTQMPVLS